MREGPGSSEHELSHVGNAGEAVLNDQCHNPGKEGGDEHVCLPFDQPIKYVPTQ